MDNSWGVTDMPRDEAPSAGMRRMQPQRADPRALAPEDIELHERLLRLGKGMLKAYEQWLEAKKQHLS